MRFMPSVLRLAALSVGVVFAIPALAVIFSLQAGSFPGFFAGFIALFFFTGVGNASTFQMIPVIMGREVPRLMPQLTGADRAFARCGLVGRFGHCGAGPGAVHDLQLSGARGQ